MELRTGGSLCRSESIAIITRSLSLPNWTGLFGEMEQQSQKLKAQEQQVESLQSQLSEAKQALKLLSLAGASLLDGAKSRWPTNRLRSGAAVTSQLEQLQEQDLTVSLETDWLKEKMEERLSVIEAAKRLLLQKLSKSSRIKTLFRIASISYRPTCLN